MSTFLYTIVCILLPLLLLSTHTYTYTYTHTYVYGYTYTSSAAYHSSSNTVAVSAAVSKDDTALLSALKNLKHRIQHAHDNITVNGNTDVPHSHSDSIMWSNQKDDDRGSKGATGAKG
jgi:hypothetical protein